MVKFCQFISTVIAVAGLMLSASQSQAQKPDVGDQPGLMADDSSNWTRNSGVPRCSIEQRSRPAPSSSRPLNAIYT